MNQNQLLVINKLIAAYKIWYGFIPHLPKSVRHTLISKIDLLFLEVIENAFVASYLSNQEKLPVLAKSITKLDLVKFFLQISWEIRALDNKKYIALSEKLDEIGRMLGGWKKALEKKLSPSN